MSEFIKYNFHGKEEQIFPKNTHVKNWLFDEGQEDEAHLAEFMARVGEKNGLNQNHFMHLFPAILRMLKSDIKWSK